ncbi:MAG TPA: glycoside hydrolase family 16 protein, partial [Cyclobacteriaceae bacterium]|nr:glycoside hydrolase family 16 protein [Cyclobacteriaceae bacterium]
MKYTLLLITLILAGITTHAQPYKNKYHKSFVEDFTKPKLKNFRYGSSSGNDKNKWESGFDSPTEPGISVLSFLIGPTDSAGAGRGPEIISKYLTHFGTYAARLKVPDVHDIQPNVGVVVGYFTYHMDRSGPGLSEIDWEWLIADPKIIYIGTWTGRRDSLKRIGRTINMAEGTILHTN